MKKVIALLLMVFLAAGTAFADGKGHSKDGKKGLEQKVCYKAKLIKKYGEEAGLTEDQIQQVKDLKYTTQKQVVEMNAKIESLKLDIWRAIYTDPADLTKINTLIDQKYDVKRDKAKLLVDAYIQMKNIPTKEQWKQIKSAKGQCGR